MFGVKNVLSAWQVSSLDCGISFGQGNQELDRNSVSGSTETPVRDRVQLRILESGKKMTIRFSVQGNLCGVVCVSVQGVQGHLCEVSRTNLPRQGWTTTTCKSPTINTLKTSSRMFGRS